MRIALTASLLGLALSAATASAQIGPNGATASFRGSLPPKPTADLSPEQITELETELAALTQAFAAVKKHERSADAAIFLKAVRYAIDFKEWYDKKPADGVKKAQALLAEAKLRIEGLAKNDTPWTRGSGQKVLGFYSRIDDSAQPYGVEIPEGLDCGAGKKAVPMWVWLHGRGDTATDLHFVYSRLMAKKPGQFQPAGTIVIHPFGRYCNGWKSAGETDVFECRNDAIARFNIDTARVALAGFSMGGAGAWHMGAHFADQWAVIHTGAGFADVKRYTKLTPDKYPAWYEQTLWGVYDVPDYARNFANTPLICYSGENDSQRDSAEYMVEVLAKQDLHPPHLIGPGMGHKYHPEVIKDVQQRIEAGVSKGRDATPKKVTLQFRSARYATMAWIECLEVKVPGADTRIDAEIVSASELKVSTQNVTAFRIPSTLLSGAEFRLSVNGETLTISKAKAQTKDFLFLRHDAQTQHWRLQVGWNGELAKLAKAGLTSMEDALRHRFVIVPPDKPGANAAVDAWVKAEMEHFITRWRGLMRGDPIVAKVGEVWKPNAATNYDGGDVTLVLWGTPETNSLIADLCGAKNKFILAGTDQPFPAQWTKEQVSVGHQAFPASHHVLCAAYPRGQSTRTYRDADPSSEPEWGSVILNTGLTFREAHDKTNSLQNPKLPDWAILDITQAANSETAGKVVAADFFDAHWQVADPSKLETKAKAAAPSAGQ